MGQWLANDLAAAHPACVLAYWHHPRYYSMSVESGRVGEAGPGRLVRQ